MRDQILTFARKRRPGYLDLANDLISVAEFYEVPEVKDLISRDPMHYRATDPQHAGISRNSYFAAWGR